MDDDDDAHTHRHKSGETGGGTGRVGGDGNQTLQDQRAEAQGTGPADRKRHLYAVQWALSSADRKLVCGVCEVGAPPKGFAIHAAKWMSEWLQAGG